MCPKYRAGGLVAPLSPCLVSLSAPTAGFGPLAPVSGWDLTILPLLDQELGTQSRLHKLATTLQALLGLGNL